MNGVFFYFGATFSSPWMQFALILAYGVVIFALWRTPVLFPFKLITVYIHEMGHALAGVLTGAKIKGIEVNPDEGGVCHLEGGNMWLILPAGYLGSSVFGSLLILLGNDRFLSKIAAVILVLGMLLALWWAKNWLTRGLTLASIVVLILLGWLWKGAGLPYLISFVGTMSALYAIYDIYDDTIRRNIASSDASKLAEMTKIPSIVWGGLWFLFSCGMLIGALYLGVYLQPT